MISIFEFWNGAPPNAPIHPADAQVLGRTDHGFDLECLPGQWMGPLATARVVFLYLSPGLSPFDRTPEGRAWQGLQRDGHQPLPGPNDHEDAFKWWSGRLKFCGDWKNFQSIIAFANIGAYHSKSFKQFHLLAALPSSRAMLDWAQATLFEEAKRHERIVVCMRSAKHWGLAEGLEEGSLYVPEVNRSGFLIRGMVRDELGATITNFLRA